MQDKPTLTSHEILSVLEEELNRIVLDVHDGPVQNLFAALSLLTQIQHDLEVNSPDAERLKPKIQQVSDVIEKSLHEIKFFLGTFRSPGFQDRPLEKLVSSLIMQHEDWTQQVVELEVENLPQKIALPIKIALYRILQEALSNGARHSGTDYQHVKLWTEDDHICMKVHDDGKGFDSQKKNAQQSAVQTSHIGLRGMRERITLVGGTFELHSQKDNGTTLVVKVPLL